MSGRLARRVAVTDITSGARTQVTVPFAKTTMFNIALTRWPAKIMRSAVAIAALALPSSITAQPSPADEVLAVAEAALDAISREDNEALAGLMIDGATMVAMPSGGGTPRVTTRAQLLANPMNGDFVERGWDAEVVLSGVVATVTLPYDFYRGGSWSHCGVDVFTMVATTGGWRIASLAYTVEQPPVCQPHPDGPPGG